MTETASCNGVAVLLFSVLASSCASGGFGTHNRSNEYELKEDKVGRMYRFNKSTGSLAVIRDDQLFPIAEPATVGPAERALVERMKDWGQIDVSNIESKVRLQTMWFEGLVHYQFTVTDSSAIQRARQEPLSTFTAELYDDNGFQLLRISIPVNGLTWTVNDKGKVVQRHNEGSIACSYARYSKISRWNILWSF